MRFSFTPFKNPFGSITVFLTCVKSIRKWTSKLVINKSHIYRTNIETFLHWLMKRKHASGRFQSFLTRIQSMQCLIFQKSSVDLQFVVSEKTFIYSSIQRPLAYNSQICTETFTVYSSIFNYYDAVWCTRIIPNTIWLATLVENILIQLQDQKHPFFCIPCHSRTQLRNAL